MTKVAIFEDNHSLRQTLELMLNNSDEFTTSGTYPDCDNLIKNLRSAPCDIALMDIEMPGINGIEATKLIKTGFPDVQVLIQTAFFDDDYIFNAICAGASGYILKDTSHKGYIEALRQVVEGGSPMSPGIARRVLELFKENIKPVRTTHYDLTSREKEVLTLLVAGKSYKMIASALDIAIDTVKNHIRNIYNKMHVNSGTEAVAKALRHKIIK